MKDLVGTNWTFHLMEKCLVTVGWKAGIVLKIKTEDALTHFVIMKAKQRQRARRSTFRSSNHLLLRRLRCQRKWLMKNGKWSEFV